MSSVPGRISAILFRESTFPAAFNGVHSPGIYESQGQPTQHHRHQDPKHLSIPLAFVTFSIQQNLSGCISHPGRFVPGQVTSFLLQAVSLQGLVEDQVNQLSVADAGRFGLDHRYLTGCKKQNRQESS